MKISNLVLLVFIVTFTGCFNITQTVPAYSTYTLNVQNAIPAANTILSNVQLEIKEPKVLHSVNSKHISYSTKNYTSEYYALSKWSDAPSKIIQNQIIKFLSSTNNYHFVHNSNITLRSNWQLLSEIESFHQYFKDNKAFVTFSIRVYLKSRKTIYHKDFNYTQTCEQNNAFGAVKGFNSIFNIFVKDLNRWILGSITKNKK